MDGKLNLRKKYEGSKKVYNYLIGATIFAAGSTTYVSYLSFEIFKEGFSSFGVMEGILAVAGAGATYLAYQETKRQKQKVKSLEGKI